MINTVAAILAGGRGKRMDVLCHNRPKPALPFAGRFRVIDFSLSNCVYSDISDLAILTDYQRNSMAGYIQQWRPVNAELRNMHILEPRNGSYRGTADAIYQNLGYFNKRRADAVLVLAGDHVYKFDYRKIIALHRERGADVTVGVTTVPMEQAHRFGTVSVDVDGRITEFMEKSSTPQSNLASMGIYVFNQKALTERLIEDADDPWSLHDFGFSILPRMVARDRVFSYRFDGYWQDIGTIDAYYDANMDLLGRQPLFSLNSSTPVLTPEAGARPLCTGKHGSIRDSLVSPGCVINGHVENSVLSPRVWVEEGAVVKNSVVMGNTLIGKHSVIDRCVLDEDVRVGEYCYVGFGVSPSIEDSRVTVISKGVSVPAHTAIRHTSRVSPETGLSGFAAGHPILLS